jgi:hypothetical protein
LKEVACKNRGLRHTRARARVTMWVGKCVLSFRVRNISHKGRNTSRRLKKVSCKHPGFATNTHVTRGVGNCAVIPLAEHDAGKTKKVEKVKNE